MVLEHTAKSTQDYQINFWLYLGSLARLTMLLIAQNDVCQCIIS